MNRTLQLSVLMALAIPVMVTAAKKPGAAKQADALKHGGCS